MTSGNTPKQPSKFKTQNRFHINDEFHRMHSIGSQMKSKTSMLRLRSSLWDYRDACILVKGTITVPKTRKRAGPHKRNKNLISKHFAPFTDSIGEIKRKEIDHTKYFNVVRPMHNLIDYSNNYSKIYRIFSQFYTDESFINDGVMINVLDDSGCAPIKSKEKLTGQLGPKNTNDQERKPAITDTELYLLVATLSAQDNAKHLQVKNRFWKKNYLK